MANYHKQPSIFINSLTIGNRISSTEYDHENNPLLTSYTTNALNQYEQRTIPGYATVRGSATNTAVVTVNGNPTWRLDDYFYGGDEADNATTAIMKELAIIAAQSNLYSTVTGSLFVAQTPEQYQYDDDGNLTQDGRWQYIWNGENRLIKAETRDDLPESVPRVTVEYAYDHQGRMVWKQITTPDTPPNTINYTWDDYNIIAEVECRESGVTTTYNLWGLDLSGTIQGAGGIGGLLAVYSPLTVGEGQSEGGTALPCYDANGNITEYLSTNGTISAHYEYSPFGEIVVQSGDLALTFTHRFSTKPWDTITGLRYQNRKWYNPNTARWISINDPLNDYPRPKPIIVIPLPGGKVQIPPLQNFPPDFWDTPSHPSPPPPSTPTKRPCPPTPPNYSKCSPCEEGDIKGKRQKKGYQNVTNGCGPFKPILWVIPGEWVPDNPSGLSGCSFTPACDDHDCCFGHCGTTPDECDQLFKKKMLSICQECTSNAVSRNWCEMWAGIYAWAVSGKTGKKAHDGAQSDACEECCCP